MITKSIEVYMKKIRLEFFIVPLVIFLTACSVFEFIEKNPIGFGIVVSEAVIQDIKDANDEQARAAEIIETVDEYLNVLADNQIVSLNTLINYLRNDIEGKLSDPVRKVRFQNLIMLLEIKLRDNQDSDDRLSEETLISIKHLLMTAKNTAEMFVE